jgi:hypothetical protein
MREQPPLAVCAVAAAADAGDEDRIPGFVQEDPVADAVDCADAFVLRGD